MVPDLEYRAGRLLRTDWGSPKELAEEIYSIFKSGPRSAAAEEDQPGEAASTRVEEARTIAGSDVSVDLGGVGRSIVPFGARLPAGGMGRRRSPIGEPDIARPRQMPGVADAARPQRPWNMPDPFQVPDFPPSEPARTPAEFAEIAARVGIEFPELGPGARVAPRSRPADQGPARPAAAEPAVRERRPPTPAEPPQERPGFSRPEARAAPSPPPAIRAPDEPARARAAAAEIAPLTPFELPTRSLTWDTTGVPPLPKIAEPAKIASDDPPATTGHAIWLGVVISGSGQSYQVDLYQNGFTGGAGPEVTVHIPQLDPDETIPEGTVLGCIHDYGTGYYESQVPIWLA